MKIDLETSSEARPLKLIGKRALISLEMLPFMHMLTPLALTLATLKNPPANIYSRKIFNHLKKALLKRMFKKSYLKNEQKMKFLIRGYQLLNKERSAKESPLLKSKKSAVTEIFNLNTVKEWFDSITNQSKTSDNITFLDSIPMILKNRRQFEFRSSMRLKKTINKILEHERQKEYEKCEQIYLKKFLRLSVPWTENIFKDLEEFGKKLWERYLKNQLRYDVKRRPKADEKKKKIIKK